MMNTKFCSSLHITFCVLLKSIYNINKLHFLLIKRRPKKKDLSKKKEAALVYVFRKFSKLGHQACTILLIRLTHQRNPDKVAHRVLFQIVANHRLK